MLMEADSRESIKMDNAMDTVTIEEGGGRRRVYLIAASLIISNLNYSFCVLGFKASILILTAADMRGNF